MAKLRIQSVKKYIEDNISTFHEARENGLQELKLSKILLKKNPYLFKAKNILTSQELVKNLVDAYLSSQEETMFGTFLEFLFVEKFITVINQLLKELTWSLKKMLLSIL